MRYRKALIANIRGLRRPGDTDAVVKDRYIDRIWKMYRDSIKTDATSRIRILKSTFTDAFNAYYNTYFRKRKDMTLGQKLQATLTMYENSSAYTRADLFERRFVRKGMDDLLGSEKDRKKLRKMLGLGSKEKITFDVKKVRKVGTGTTDIGRPFTVYRYQNAYFISVNSPFETYVATDEEFRQEWEPYIEVRIS